MLEMLSGQNALFLLVAVAGFWFTVRFVVAPRRGAPGLGDMFRREAAAPTIGLGRDAIATLLADTRQFAIREPAVKGLLLAGAFATKTADAASPVVLIALVEDPQAYRDDDWLARWSYPARGHAILTCDSTEKGGITSHRLTLKGAPPVEFHFLAQHAAIDEALDDMIGDGLTVIDDPAGQAAKFRQMVLARRDATG